jgi:hypothetical protein
MLNALRRHLNIANTLAALALFIALGGTVYAAGGGLSGKEIRPGSMPGNRLAPNSVTGKQVKESTLKGVHVGSAWGRVSAAGVLTEAHAVGSISHPSEGLYCLGITGRSPASAPLQVTADGSDGDMIQGGGLVTTAQWFSAGPDCPAGTYEVRTVDFLVKTGRGEVLFKDNAFSFFVP